MTRTLFPSPSPLWGEVKVRGDLTNCRSMGLSASDIAAVVKEIAPAIETGWIQKVFQPTPRAIMLEIRTPGQTLSLFMSADPETARLHLLTQRFPNPPSPPPFCQFLRAHIQGARIDGLEQVQGDRIVRLRLTAREGPCTLIAELTGRKADLLLVNGDELVMTALESAREQIGKPYQPPVLKAFPESRIESGLIGSEDMTQLFPVSYAIEQQYRTREDEFATSRWRQARLADLKKRIKKAARRVEVLRGDLDKAARYKDYARYGELLKTNLHAMKKGHERLTVVDYFDPAMPELVIPLDPSKGPKGNMDEYFKKHRKHVAAEREIRPRLAQAEEDLNALHMERANLNRDLSEPALSSALIGDAPRTRPVPQTKPKRDARSGPFRRFVSADGMPIYVGRNARENEALTFGEARPDDLWLHAHGTPGSHVVLRLDKGADPSHETLRDAATLALLYSDLKKSGKGEVIYTRRKYVRKVKGKSPGTVTVTQEKTVFVTLDRARLERLKERADDLKPM
jgi:predicted ribosome quality control (RQC) complex YloA/Tae2 family protein